MTIESFILVVALLLICAMATFGYTHISRGDSKTWFGVIVDALVVLLLYLTMMWSFFGAVWLVLKAWLGAL